DDVDAMARCRHLDPGGVEQSAVDYRVAQGGKGHGAAVAGHVPVEVERDRGAPVERTALLGLDRLRRVVEPTGEAEDLGDRPGDAEACDAVVAPAGLDGDVPGVLRAVARLLALEPGGQLSQL